MFFSVCLAGCFEWDGAGCVCQCADDVHPWWVQRYRLTHMQCFGMIHCDSKSLLSPVSPTHSFQIPLLQSFSSVFQFSKPRSQNQAVSLLDLSIPGGLTQIPAPLTGHDDTHSLEGSVDVGCCRRDAADGHLRDCKRSKCFLFC